MFLLILRKTKMSWAVMTCVFIKSERTKIKAYKADMWLTARNNEIYIENHPSCGFAIPFLTTFLIFYHNKFMICNNFF